MTTQQWRTQTGNSFMSQVSAKGWTDDCTSETDGAIGRSWCSERCARRDPSFCLICFLVGSSDGLRAILMDYGVMGSAQGPRCVLCKGSRLTVKRQWVSNRRDLMAGGEINCVGCVGAMMMGALFAPC